MLLKHIIDIVLQNEWAHFLAVLVVLSAMIAWALRRSWFNAILDFFSKFVEWIYSIEASPRLWIVAFLSITFMRDFWENFIEHPATVIGLGYHFEYSLGWFVYFFCLAIFMYFISGEKISRISRLMVIGFLVIFIAPFFDLAYYWGHSFSLGFNEHNPLHNFFTFYSACRYGHEATMGIRVEILLAMILAVIFTASKTRNWAKSLIAGLGIYILIFFVMALPAIYESYFPYLFHPQKVNEMGLPIGTTPSFEFPYDYIRVFLLVLAVVIPVYLWLLGFQSVRKIFTLDLSGLRPKLRKSTLLALAQNIRPSRVIHYGILVLIGVFLSVHYTYAKFTFINVMHVGSLLGSVLFAWAFAVGVNDIYDQNIDRISNPDRPLITGSISTKEYGVYTAIFAVVSLMLALVVSFWAASIIFYYMVYYSFVYSAPPLRLRQYLVLPNVLIGVCSLLCVLLGFSILGGERTFALMPKGIAFFIFLAFSFASVVKDLKDYEGDKAAGIATLPTLLGLPRARILTALLIAAMFAITPLFIKIPKFWIYSSLFAIVSFYMVMKKSEKYVFGLWFIFAVVFCMNLTFSISNQKIGLL